SYVLAMNCLLPSERHSYSHAVQKQWHGSAVGRLGLPITAAEDALIKEFTLKRGRESTQLIVADHMLKPRSMAFRRRLLAAARASLTEIAGPAKVLEGTSGLIWQHELDIANW